MKNKILMISAAAVLCAASFSASANLTNTVKFYKTYIHPMKGGFTTFKFDTYTVKHSGVGISSAQSDATPMDRDNKFNSPDYDPGHLFRITAFIDGKGTANLLLDFSISPYNGKSAFNATPVEVTIPLINDGTGKLAKINILKNMGNDLTCAIETTPLYDSIDIQCG